MSLFLQYFILVPVVGFLLSLLAPRKNENLVSVIVLTAITLQLIGLIAFTGWWIIEGAPSLDIKQLVLYESHGFVFFIDFCFDRVTAVFALVGAVLTFLVAVFSRYYMHREQGFKRFFNTLLLFFAGYNTVVFAGNFETLFIGWEALGITSFLLIAFYRDRYLPVKNGYKVLSFYRLGDICLILAMWMSHHLWHKNITFAEVAQQSLVVSHYSTHFAEAMFIGMMIVLAAAIKSAQLPFSTWLPRAMEGPTTSSAIFYGSLSVHIGAFLLLRTHLFWEHEFILDSAILVIGLITSVVATMIARVQSSVKTQIAYASIAQIGLIFVEIALGFQGLALLHFAGNAFLRTYQLLVSPSVLSYRVHDMFFNFTPRTTDSGNTLGARLRRALYVLSIKEWNFDFLLHRYLWRPFKWMGSKLTFLGHRLAQAGLLLLLVAGVVLAFNKETAADALLYYLPEVFATMALLLVLNAFTTRKSAHVAWLMALGSQLFTALAVLWNKDFNLQQTVFYLSGTIVAGLVGYLCLRRLQSKEGEITLDQYHGHSYEYPILAMVFLLSCLGLAGFPITPTFIGIDLMFTHIDKHQLMLIVLMALIFLFLELGILRIYARIFLGQHKKAYHPVAFKSS